jgi:Ca2+-dependent lipid-binding protein
MGILTVYLDKVENLLDDDFRGKSDPFVKFELEQNNVMFDKDFGEQKSSKKRDQQSPHYGETFHFNIPSLHNMELIVKVMDDDVLKDDKMGQCKINLEELDLTSHAKEVKKKIDHKLFRKDAFVHLKLSYSE